MRCRKSRSAPGNTESPILPFCLPPIYVYFYAYHSLFAFFGFQKMSFHHARNEMMMILDPPSSSSASQQLSYRSPRRDMTSAEAANFSLETGHQIRSITSPEIPGCSNEHSRKMRQSSTRGGIPSPLHSEKDSALWGTTFFFSIHHLLGQITSCHFF